LATFDYPKDPPGLDPTASVVTGLASVTCCDIFCCTDDTKEHVCCTKKAVDDVNDNKIWWAKDGEEFTITYDDSVEPSGPDAVLGAVEVADADGKSVGIDGGMVVLTPPECCKNHD
jgi:hypothetical protein